MLKTHGMIELRSGRMQIRTDYCPRDDGPGFLAIKFEDQSTYECVEFTIRLDPWDGDEYRLIESAFCDFFVICGAQAVVVIDVMMPAITSSVGLEYQEGETIDSPWYVESEKHRLVVVATERRVWCVNDRGAVRWLWSCSSNGEERWVCGGLVIVDDAVRVPLRAVNGDFVMDIQLDDGLPKESLRRVR